MDSRFLCVALVALQASQFMLSVACSSVLNAPGAPESSGQLTIESTSSAQNRKQTAPYAINDNDAVQNSGNNSVKNLVFRLTLTNRSAGANYEYQPGEPWTLTNLNGTALDRAGLDVSRLLKTLNDNNFTSEIHYDDLNQNSGTLNITISSWINNSSNNNSNHLASLEELIAESRSLPTNNISDPVVIDNHQFKQPKQATRSRPSAELLVPSVVNTVPPIRKAHDVLAENYTVRKVAEEANVFAFKLLNELNIEKLGSHNIVQSPFSIYQNLALLFAGAHGDTARELDRVLLGSQSVYDNTRLTHDQDRARLLASFSDNVLKLYKSSTNHFQLNSCNRGSAQQDNDSNCEQDVSKALDMALYNGGTEEQHLILANNLLVSPSAFEFSSEFKNLIKTHYSDTALTRTEVGSTESVQVINNWIRRATAGLIPGVLRKTQTFDEFNTMTVLSTSWLAQEWRDTFDKVSSALRSNVRLRGQSGPKISSNLISRQSVQNSVESLLEFVDDSKVSHFVEYIKSEPTRNMHHYNSLINGQMVDLVVVQFRDSNHRFVALTPVVDQSIGQQSLSLAAASLTPMFSASNQSINSNNIHHQADTWNQTVPRTVPLDELPDASPLTRFIAALADNPKRAQKVIWGTIAPEIITKQTYQSMQIALGQQIANMNSSFAIPPLVRLSMPIFRAQADASLSAALNHVGLVNAFDKAQANFIGINGHPFNYHQLHLSNVLYKTTMNFNEYGINYDRTVRTLEAMRLSSQSKNRNQNANTNLLGQQRLNQQGASELVDEIRLNKPFVYMICDIKTRLILYTGVVRNPAKEDTA